MAKKANKYLVILEYPNGDHYLYVNDKMVAAIQDKRKATKFDTEKDAKKAIKECPIYFPNKRVEVY